MGFENFNWLNAAIGIIAFDFLFKTYVELRQLKKYQIKKLPKELENISDDEKFAKSQAYSSDRLHFRLFESGISIVTNLLFLYYKLLPVLWGFCKDIALKYGYTNEIMISNIFLVVILLMTTVMGIPFELYRTFVIEEKYGYNKMTLKLFIKDKIIALVLSILAIVIFCSILIYVIQWAGANFWIYALAVIFAFSMFLISIYPTLIAPLFNKYTPVEGELKDSIMKLADKVKFPATKIYVVDNSKRSNHMNAYFYGFFKNKRIVIYDTLIKELTTDELLSVLCHEFSHYLCNHTTYLIIFQQIYIAQFLYLFGLFINETSLYTSFGFHEQSIMIGLILFSLVFQPVDLIFSFIMNVFSRKFEYQADEYALKLGCKELDQALIKLHVKDGASLIVDPLYSAVHYTHPTLLERLSHMKKIVQSLKTQ